MSGLGRLRVRLGRARMSIGKCGELRRSGPVREGPVFRRPAEEVSKGPSFGSWF